MEEVELKNELPHLAPNLHACRPKGNVLISMHKTPFVHILGSVWMEARGRMKRDEMVSF
jgi:hypothetical protein